jgi:hypothetical protein
MGTSSVILTLRRNPAGGAVQEVRWRAGRSSAIHRDKGFGSFVTRAGRNSSFIELLGNFEGLPEEQRVSFEEEPSPKRLRPQT